MVNANWLIIGERQRLPPIQANELFLNCSRRQARFPAPFFERRWRAFRRERERVANRRLERAAADAGRRGGAILYRLTGERLSTASLKSFSRSGKDEHHAAAWHVPRHRSWAMRLVGLLPAS